MVHQRGCWEAEPTAARYLFIERQKALGMATVIIRVLNVEIERDLRRRRRDGEQWRGSRGRAVGGSDDGAAPADEVPIQARQAPHPRRYSFSSDLLFLEFSYCFFRFKCSIFRADLCFAQSTSAKRN